MNEYSDVLIFPRYVPLGLLSALFRIILFLLVISACALEHYETDLLADGKTWKIQTTEVRCAASNKKDCIDQLSAGLANEAKEICGNVDCRIFSCKFKDSDFLGHAKSKATCFLKCLNETKAPSPGPKD